MKCLRRSAAVLGGAVVLAGSAFISAEAEAVGGGTAATDGVYGFAAKITMDGSACSGALVTPDWVITSASCFVGNPQGGVPAKVTTATVGRTNLAGTAGQVAKVTNLVAHPNRAVMLARLDTTIASVTPVSLGAAAASGEKVRLAGDGRTATEWVPDKLHSALFAVGTPTATEIPLTGDNDADTCKGDAGGAVFREISGRAELVGVVSTSWQHGCLAVTETQQGTTATRTDDLTGWIRQQTFVATAKAVSHAITVNWPPVTGQGQPTYRVYAGSTPDVPTAPANLVGTTTGTGFLHKSLAAKKTWYYRVVATLADGTVVPTSNVASAVTPVPTVTDFSGDGKDDIAVFTRGSTADVFAAVSDGTKFVGNSVKWHDRFATNNEVPLAGDFNGDGKTDIATFTRGTTGDVYVALSDGGKFVGDSQQWHGDFAFGDEIPAVGDFDGDGKDDIAVFTRGTLADVYVALSDGKKFVGNGVKWHDRFAGGAEIPAVGDFDGDGKADIATFTRGTTGDVFVAFSDGGKFVGDSLQWHTDFAFGGEIPATGDFDGDGKDDIAVFTRGTTADVYVALSNGVKFVGNGVRWHGNFALGAEVPAIGDFTGDGKADIATYTRGTTADVYAATSDGGQFVGASVQWHGSFAFGEEVPLPRAFALGF